MLTCRELAQRYASDYLDGQLGWRARFGVRCHLLICEHCRRFVAQLRKVRTLLRDRVPSDSIPSPAEEAAARELGGRLAAAYTAHKQSPEEKKPPPL